MFYKVVPFNAVISQGEGAANAAHQLEVLIANHILAGFELVGMESIPTHVAGNDGCFGIGAVPASTVNYPVVIFRRSEASE